MYQISGTYYINTQHKNILQFSWGGNAIIMTIFCQSFSQDIVSILNGQNNPY